MTIAKKVLNSNNHDNMVLNRLVSRNNYQEFMPVEVDQNFDKEETAYIFDDGSALINSADNDWKVATNYGKNVDHQRY